MLSKTNIAINTLLEKAIKLGIEEADVIAIESFSLNVTSRLTKLEGIEQNESTDIGLRVINNGKQLTISTTDNSTESMVELAKQAVSMVHAVPRDEFCGLPDKSLHIASNVKLDLVDKVQPKYEELLEDSINAEESAMSVKGITNTEGASSSFSKNKVSLVNSNGFNNCYERTGYSRTVSVIAGSGTNMERDYEYQYATHMKDLDKPSKIGLIAGKRTISKLNSKKIKSNTVPIIFDKRVSGGLISLLTGSISGQAISRGTSFLKNKLGKKLFNKNINIIDDPLRIRGHRSRTFDGEGVATKKNKLISNGILTSWLLDCRSARQINFKTTASANRNTNSPPTPAPSNVYLSPGDISKKDLIKSVNEGFYVTEMMGMSFNQINGDYSRGASGFWILNGEVVFPVSEVTIAGNMLDMYKTLIPASDLKFQTGIDAPTFMVENMTVAGI